MNNKYLYNGGAEWQNEFDLNLHMTPNRMLDPALGRFWGIDKLSDLMPGSSPMAYGYNNPIFFNDPLGLAGVPGCDECEGTVLDEVVVTASRLPQTDYSFLFNSSNPVHRNLGLRAKNNDREYIQHAFNQSPIQYGEGLGYTTQFQQGINTIAGGVSSSLVVGTAGVVGSAVIIYGAPILLELSLTQASIEAGTQITTNLLMEGNINNLDVADVIIAGTGLGILGSSTLGSAIDIQPFAQRGERISAIGFGKDVSSTIIDFSLGLVGGGSHKFVTGSGFKLYSGSMSGSSGNVGYSLKGMSSTYSNIWKVPIELYSKGLGKVIGTELNSN